MKVFIPELEEPQSLERLTGLEVKIGVEGKSYSEEELAKEISDADIVVITSQYRISKRIIDAAPRLRGIVKYGSKPGSDNVDMSAANERRILVAYTEGANSDSVAEFTLALTLALAKKLPHAISLVRNQMWRNPACLGIELAEKTVGIVGLGVIGFKVAQKLSGFNVKILAHDPYVSKEKGVLVHAKLVDLDTLLRSSDVVSLHAKVTAETKNMIGKQQLGLMKSTAFLINTARGALTDEMALYEALCERRIAGAALDVFETEPPSPNNPLLSLENVIITPHVASWTADALRKEAFMAMDEVQRIATGIRPVNLANPELYLQHG